MYRKTDCVIILTKMGTILYCIILYNNRLKLFNCESLLLILYCTENSRMPVNIASFCLLSELRPHIRFAFSHSQAAGTEYDNQICLAIFSFE